MVGSKLKDDASNTLPLESLPWHVQRALVQKLDVLSFFRLKRCSEGSLTLCRDSKHMPVLSVNTLTVRDPDNVVVNWFCESRQRNVLSQLNRMDPSTCRIHVELFEKAGGPFDTNCCNMFRGRSVRIHKICIQGPVSCTAEAFNSFLEEHGIKEVDLRRSVGTIDWENLLEQPAVRQLSSLNIGSGHLLEFSAQAILQLRATTLQLPRINSTVIQTMLQEWREGVREIGRYAFWYVTDLSAVAGPEQQLFEIQTGVLAPVMKIRVMGNLGDNFVCLNATMTRNDRSLLPIAISILNGQVSLLVGS